MSYHVQKIIDRVCWELGWSTSDSAKRARILDVLNDGERYIAAQGSFLYLSKLTQITVNNAAARCAVPSNPAMDYGKLAVVEDDIGKLKYVPPDRFSTGAVTSFYSLRNNRPAVWTFGLDEASAPFLFFSPANTTGGNLTFNMRYQRVVADLLDANNSFSLLPDGYEVTLLKQYAVSEIKGVLKRDGAGVKNKDFNDQLISFYAGQRTTKLYSRTDTETAQRNDDDVNEEA